MLNRNKGMPKFKNIFIIRFKAELIYHCVRVFDINFKPKIRN